jgi:hypothetical protein
MMNVSGISSGSFLDQIQKKQDDNLEKLASGKKKSINQPMALLRRNY